MEKTSIGNRAVALLTIGYESLAFLAVFLSGAGALAQTTHIQVDVLTPQGSKVLKTWGSGDIQKLLHGKTVSLSKIFEESTAGLDWKERAEIDLLNIYGQKPNELVRLPRFIAFRDWANLHYHNLSGRVSLEIADRARLSVPKSALELDSISRIELTRHAIVYPGIELKVRTNPAASRGEKLFEQNCMSCHSIPGQKTISPTVLTKTVLSRFPADHHRFSGLSLSAKDERGLEAYRDALASEKNEVKSPK